MAISKISFILLCCISSIVTLKIFVLLKMRSVFFLNYVDLINHSTLAFKRNRISVHFFCHFCIYVNINKIQNWHLPGAHIRCVIILSPRFLKQKTLTLIFPNNHRSNLQGSLIVWRGLHQPMKIDLTLTQRRMRAVPIRCRR